MLLSYTWDGDIWWLTFASALIGELPKTNANLKPIEVRRLQTSSALFWVGRRSVDPFSTQLMTHRIAINRCQPYSFFLNWMNCPPNILGNDPCNTCQNDSPSNTSNGCLNRNITHHYSMMTSSSLLSRDITDCVAFCILLQTLQARFLGWRLSIGTSSDLTPWRPFWMFVSRLRLFNQWLNQIWFLVRVDGL